MFNKKKKVKEKKSIQDKDFVRFSKVYPECDVIELKHNVFLKMIKITDKIKSSSCEAYNQILVEHLKSGQQFFYYKGETFVVMKIEADYIDDAVMKFNGMIFEYSELVPGFELEDVSVKEWLDMICQMTQFRDFDEEVWNELTKTQDKNAKKQKKTKHTIKQQVQPWDRKTNSEYLQLGEKISKNIMITNFPAKVFSGLVTEIMEISDNIVGSLYIRKVDNDKCLAALDMSAENNTQRVIMRKHLENQLYHCCLFLNISGYEGEVDRIYKKVEELATKYLSGINHLEHQQTQAFLSVLPLCDNFIRYNKVLPEESAIGLLNFSWVKRLHSGLKYGKSNISGKEVYYNRLLENSSGFYLGSDYADVKKRTKIEIKQIQNIAPEKKIAVFTLGGVDMKSESFVDISSCSLLGDDLELNREILRAFYYMTCGTTGNVSERYKSVINTVLMDDGNVRSYDSFLLALKNQSPDVAVKFSTMEVRKMFSTDEPIEQKTALAVYRALASTNRENVVRMMAAIAQCDADVVYILNGEAIAKLHNNEFINLILRRKKQMITVIGTDGMTMYRSPQFKQAMRESDFIHISKCNTLEKVNLVSILKLNKEQANYIAEDGCDVLITKYAEYLIDERENEE